ncbi:MAG: hypothetical protein WBL62_02990, partial [Gallionella sp.]
TAPAGDATNVGRLIASSGSLGLFGTVVRNSGTVSADSATMQGGKIVFRASQRADIGGTVSATSTAVPSPSGGGLGWGNSGEGNGGTIQVLGKEVLINAGATLDASGTNGGGTILVGGDAHGTNANVQNALNTFVDATASIKADGGIPSPSGGGLGWGNGGKVVVWADNATQFNGNISAQGGALGGNGGWVEVSGKQRLGYNGLTNTLAAKGLAGTLLLDPTDITISAAPSTATLVNTTGTFTDTTAVTSNLNTTTLQTQLGLSNVIVDTTSALAGAGNITVQDSIAWNSLFGLTLNATGLGSILVNATNLTGGTALSIANTGLGGLSLISANDIVVNGAMSTMGGNVLLNANAAGTGGAIVMNTGSSITSNGGNVTLGGGTPGNGSGNAIGNATYVNGIYFGGATLNAGGGNIALNGTGFAGASANGVYVTSTSRVQTSGAGTIALNGMSGSSSLGNNSGVRIGTGAILTSVNGAISLTGQGGASTGSINTGVYVHNNSAISATGSGAVSLNGTVGSIGMAGVSNRGVRISTGASISTISGNIGITGQGAWNGDGVQVMGASTVQSTSGGINIAGISGDGTGSIYGVHVNASNVLTGNTLISTAGNILINGTSMATAGSSNDGVNLGVRGVVSTAGTGTTTITGQGGSGVDFNSGILVSGATVSVVDGLMSLNGTAGSGTGSYLYGINLQSSAQVKATGLGGINLVGTVNGAAGFNAAGLGYAAGVRVASGSLLQTVSGAINLTGSGLLGTTLDYGVRIKDAVTSVNSSTGAITLNGTGWGTGAASYGVAVDLGAAVVTGGLLNVNSSGTVGNATLLLSGAPVGGVVNAAAGLNVNGTGAVIADGGISAGTVVVNAAGGTTLAGTNTFGRLDVQTGGVVVSGTLNVTAGPTILNGAFVNNGGSIYTASKMTFNGSVTFNGGSVLGGSLSALGVFTPTLNSQPYLAFNGPLTIGSGTLPTTLNHLQLEAFGGATQGTAGVVGSGAVILDGGTNIYNSGGVWTMNNAVYSLAVPVAPAVTPLSGFYAMPFGTVTIPLGGTATFNAGVSFNSAGTTNLLGTLINFNFVNSGVLNVGTVTANGAYAGHLTNTGTLNATAGANFLGDISNDLLGTMNISGGTALAPILFQRSLYNAGTLNINNTFVSLNNDLMNSGTVNMTTSTVNTNMCPGCSTLNGGSNFGNKGIVNVTSANTVNRFAMGLGGSVSGTTAATDVLYVNTKLGLTGVATLNNVTLVTVPGMAQGGINNSTPYTLTLQNGAVINNGSTWSMHSGDTIAAGAGAASVFNNLAGGTLEINDPLAVATPASINVPIVNSGLFNVINGTLNLNGSYVGNTGSSVNISGGSLNAAGAFSTPILNLSGGALSGLGSLSVGGSFSQTAGTLGNTFASINITQALGDLSVGSMGASGALNLTATTGAIVVNGNINSSLGDVALSAVNGITQSADISAFGNVTLTANATGSLGNYVQRLGLTRNTGTVNPGDITINAY